MQRCAKLLRLWNNGGIGVPIRTGFPVPALASYCAPVAQQVKLEGPETSSMWSYGNNMIPTTSEELYSKSRILKSCEMCVRRGMLVLHVGCLFQIVSLQSMPRVSLA